MTTQQGYKNITFDDRNSTFLHYTGWWFNTGSWNATHVGQTGTLSSSTNSSANVTFSFPVPAKGFYFYGIPRCCGGIYAVCIDCEPTNPHFELIDAVNETDDGQNPPIVLYSKTWDTPGLHEIILTNQEDPRYGGNSMITIDRFELEVESDEEEAAKSESTSPPAETSSSPGSSSSSSQSTVSSSGPSTGAIAGGVIGGVIFVVLLLGLCFFLGRRKRRRDEENGRRAGPRSAEPYMVSQQDMQQRQQPQSQYLSQDPYHDPQLGHLGRSAKALEGLGLSTSLTSMSSNYPSIPQHPQHGTLISSATSNPDGTLVQGGTFRLQRRETDAGRVPMRTEDDDEDDDDDDDTRTLPPEYEQVFRRPQRDGEEGQGRELPSLPPIGTDSGGSGGGPYGGPDSATSQSPTSPSVSSPYYYGSESRRHKS